MKRLSKMNGLTSTKKQRRGIKQIKVRGGIMKRIILSLVIFLLIFAISANAKEDYINNDDGSDWDTYSKLEKEVFITGFMGGTYYVGVNSYQTISKKFDKQKAKALYYLDVYQEDKKSSKNSFSREEVLMILEFERTLFNNNQTRYEIAKITTGHIVKGLDLLYSDFKNRRIKITDAVYVVKKQITGSHPEEIEAVLQYLRAGEDRDKLWYTDKDGKKQFADFP